jgi:hypothetical protein
MDTYRIWNKITHEWWEVEANSIDKALLLTGCARRDCVIKIKTQGEFAHGWKVVR